MKKITASIIIFVLVVIGLFIGYKFYFTVQVTDTFMGYEWGEAISKFDPEILYKKKSIMVFDKDTVQVYTVKKEDNLIKIAREFNVTPNQIIEANNLGRTFSLYSGLRLVIPDTLFTQYINKYDSATTKEVYDYTPDHESTNNSKSLKIYKLQKKNIGAVEINEGMIFFYDDKFYRVWLDFAEDEDLQIIRKVLTSKYNEPDSIVTQPAIFNQNKYVKIEIWNTTKSRKELVIDQPCSDFKYELRMMSKEILSKIENENKLTETIEIEKTIDQF